MIPTPVSTLRNATLPGGQLCDVILEGAIVGDVVPAGTASLSPDTSVDLEGRLLLPAGAEPHAHLDKAYTWDLIDPPFGDLGAAIESFHARESEITAEDTYRRARRAALRLLANGTTVVRSHVNVLGGDQPFRNVDAMVRLRDDLAGIMDLELVALPPTDTDEATIEQAMDRGLDLVGGAPHLAEDPIAEIERLARIAERRAVGIDLHTDESLDGPLTITDFARRVKDWPADRIRTAGHCVRLGTLPLEELADVVAQARDAQLGIVTLPITNLYLQGWSHPVSTPRGLTAIHALLDAGVVVGAGADNVRDPFNPIGRSDPFETAALLVVAGHVDLARAWELVSNGSRAVMGRPTAGAHPGAAADFVAIAADTVGEAIAEASADRIVIHRGRVVARTAVQQTLGVAMGEEVLQ